MILTAHQPAYIPWLGLFDKISKAETFCLLDDVQYSRKSFINRNLIKTNNGPLWLTVPVESRNHYQIKIKDIRIVHNAWQYKHLKSIQLAYSKAKYYTVYIQEIEKILNNKEWNFLVDLNRAWLDFGLSALGIDTRIVNSSDFSFKGSKSTLISNMCSQLGATSYIFGELGEGYANKADFDAINVEIYFQKYKHPVYNQMHGDFLSHLSFIDLLLNEGPGARSIILNQGGNIVSQEK